MKHKTILQRIAAFVLAVLTAFSMLPAATAYAAGEAGTVTFTYCYDSDGNMILYNGETNVDGYTRGNQRGRIHRRRHGASQAPYVR